VTGSSSVFAGAAVDPPASHLCGPREAPPWEPPGRLLGATWEPPLAPDLVNPRELVNN